MDSDKEMIQQIMDDEAACDDNVQKHLAITACLQMLEDAGEEEEAASWRFKAGKKEVKATTEVEGSYHAIQRLLL
jgi:hypothetical protein